MFDWYAVLSRQERRTLIAAFGGWSVDAFDFMIYTFLIATWIPTYLKTERGLSVLNTGAYTFVLIAGSLVGYLVAAYCSDLLGRRRTFLLFGVCTGLAAVLYTLMPISNTAMLPLGFVLGFFLSGNFSGVGAFLTELFPSRVRGSGQGFAYNFGRGFGAFSPPLVGHLSEQDRVGAGHRHRGRLRLHAGDRDPGVPA